MIKLTKKKVKGKNRRLLQKVGCKGNKRTTRATFITEATASQPRRRSPRPSSRSAKRPLSADSS